MLESTVTRRTQDIDWQVVIDFIEAAGIDTYTCVGFTSNADSGKVTFENHVRKDDGDLEVIYTECSMVKSEDA